MKKLYTLLTLLMLSLTSCEVSESEFGTITIDDEYASITLDGGATTKMASFKSTVSWKAIITNNMSDNDNTPTWISISQTSGSAGNSTIDIEVETNKTGSSRSAVIKIYSSFAQKEIIVTQNYDRYSDEDENTDENEDEDEDDEGNTLSQTVTLSELSSSQYPTNSSIWRITDTNATSEDMSGLRSALTSYYNSTGNTVSLEFPNLKSMPEGGLESRNEINAITLSRATTIGINAFYGCTNLTEISLPAATAIESWAFTYCDNLTEISIPTATSIGSYAFAFCDNLTEISLPAATTIESYAFAYCDNLTTVSLPAATSIGRYAFSSCDNLTEVLLPAATSIDTWAFDYCDNLTTLEIATNSNIIIDYCSLLAFNGVTLSNVTLSVGSANSSMVSGNYITIDGYKLGPFKEIIVNGSASGGDASDDKTSYSLSELSSSSYPTSSSTWIITDSRATESDFSGLKSALSSYYKSTNNTVSLEFPNLISMPEGGLETCNEINAIAINRATTIESLAFSCCENLTNVSLPAATSIGSYTFYGCTNLTEISLPAATAIESYAFYSCTNLSQISLPAVTSIGSFAFHSCNNLTTLEIATNSNDIISSCHSLAFNGVTLSNVTLTVGIAYRSVVSGNYITIDGSKFGPFKEIIINGITSCSLSELSSSSYPTSSSIWIITDINATESDFSGLESALSSYYSSTGNTVSLEFPNLTSMPSYGLRWCDEINAITLSKATTIGIWAFDDCENLTEVSLPAATSIGSSAFYSCDNLTTVSLPAATSIGSSAFNKCENLTTLEIATNSNVIIDYCHSWAFYGVTLSNVTLTVGSANSSMVSGNYITIDGLKFGPFREIITK